MAASLFGIALVLLIATISVATTSIGGVSILTPNCFSSGEGQECALYPSHFAGTPKDFAVVGPATWHSLSLSFPFNISLKLTITSISVAVLTFSQAANVTLTLSSVQVTQEISSPLSLAALNLTDHTAVTLSAAWSVAVSEVFTMDRSTLVSTADGAALTVVPSAASVDIALAESTITVGSPAATGHVYALVVSCPQQMQSAPACELSSINLHSTHLAATAGGAPTEVSALRIAGSSANKTAPLLRVSQRIAFSGTNVLNATCISSSAKRQCNVCGAIVAVSAPLLLVSAASLAIGTVATRCGPAIGLDLSLEAGVFSFRGVHISVSAISGGVGSPVGVALAAAENAAVDLLDSHVSLRCLDSAANAVAGISIRSCLSSSLRVMHGTFDVVGIAGGYFMTPPSSPNQFAHALVVLSSNTVGATTGVASVPFPSTAPASLLAIRCNVFNGGALDASAFSTAPVYTSFLACGSCDYEIDCNNVTTAAAKYDSNTGRCLCECSNNRTKLAWLPVAQQCFNISASSSTTTTSTTTTTAATSSTSTTAAGGTVRWAPPMHTDNNWNTATNWEPPRVPGPYDDVVIANASLPPQSIGLFSLSVTVKSIILSQVLLTLHGSNFTVATRIENASSVDADTTFALSNGAILSLSGAVYAVVTVAELGTIGCSESGALHIGALQTSASTGGTRIVLSRCQLSVGAAGGILPGQSKEILGTFGDDTTLTLSVGHGVEFFEKLIVKRTLVVDGGGNGANVQIRSEVEVDQMAALRILVPLRLMPAKMAQIKLFDSTSSVVVTQKITHITAEDTFVVVRNGAAPVTCCELPCETGLDVNGTGSSFNTVIALAREDSCKATSTMTTTTAATSSATSTVSVISSTSTATITTAAPTTSMAPPTDCSERSANSTTCLADEKCIWSGANQCELRCEFLSPIQVPNSTACSLFSACTWADWGACVTKCELLSAVQCQSKVSLALTRCSVRSAGFRGNFSYEGQKCFESCGNEYSTADSCSADQNCMWNDITGGCQTSCARLAFEEEVKDGAGAGKRACESKFNLLCMYISGLGCVRSCMLNHSTLQSCNIDPNCSWSSVTDKCGPNCDANDATSCTSNSLCRWHPGAEQQCLVDCGFYWRRSECKADPDCTWLDSLAYCSASCFVSATRAECDSRTEQCLWNAKEGLCWSRCSFKYNSSQAELCNKDTECTFYDGACKTRCASHASDAGCLGDDTCYFQQSSGRCYTKCSFINSVSLNWMECQQQSAVCDLLQLTTHGGYENKCVEKCSVRFLSKSACDADSSSCLFDQATEQCKRSCDTMHLVSGGSVASNCASNHMCRYDENQQCVLRCELLPMSNCSSSNGCVVLGQNCISLPDCPSLDKASCQASAFCVWYFSALLGGKMTCGTCGAAHDHSFDASKDCNLDPKCHWNATSKTCGSFVASSTAAATSSSSSSSMSTSTTTAETTKSPVTTTSSSSTTQTPNNGASSSDGSAAEQPGISATGIAIIAVAAVVVLFIAIVITVRCWKKKQDAARTSNTQSYSEAAGLGLLASFNEELNTNGSNSEGSNSGGPNSNNSTPPLSPLGAASRNKSFPNLLPSSAAAAPSASSLHMSSPARQQLQRRFQAEEVRGGGGDDESSTAAPASVAAGSPIWVPPPSASSSSFTPDSLPATMLGAEALRSFLPNLQQILSCSFAAASNIFERLKKDPDPNAVVPLSLEEVFAIALYTFDLGPCEKAESNFYFFYNKMVLREKKSGAVAACSAYSAMLHAAMAKLKPQGSETPLFRGVGLSSAEEVEQLKKDYQVGALVTWTGVTSVSTDENVATAFQQQLQQQRDAGLGLSFVILATSARPISRYSAIPSEQELLFVPGTAGTKFTVTKMAQGATNVIHLLQISEKAVNF